MKYFQSLIIIVISITLFSCGSTNTKSTSNQNLHVQKHANMHQEHIQQESLKTINEKYIKEIIGSYQGNIPCADCDKIVYELQLNDDFTFHTKITYKGESDKPREAKGKFIITIDHIIELIDHPGNMFMFRKVSSGLRLLDKNGHEIDGQLSDLYVLQPLKEISEKDKADSNPIKYKKWEQGIYIYATGNEPFWSLDIDKNNRIHFKTLSGIDIHTPPVDPVKAMDANVSRYRAVTTSGEITVQIFDTPCADTMADEIFQLKVQIDFKPKKNAASQIFNGCGNYVPDFRLHNIWLIEKVNETVLTSVDFNKEDPRLELFIADENVFGHDGCNGFRGKIEVKDGNIIFSNLAGTMMACPNMDISSEITKALSGKTLRYELIKGKLNLYDKNNKVLILKHID